MKRFRPIFPPRVEIRSPCKYLPASVFTVRLTVKLVLVGTIASFQPGAVSFGLALFRMRTVLSFGLHCIGSSALAAPLSRIVAVAANSSFFISCQTSCRDGCSAPDRLATISSGVRLSFNNRLIGIVPPLSRRKQNKTPSYSTGFPLTAAELRKEHGPFTNVLRFVTWIGVWPPPA